jgi:tetratricopeptide (TPR) repeat protein
MIPKSLIEQSINSALDQDWHQAIEINLEILQQNPYHIATLNRLAKAYREIGQIKRAIQTYEQTLQYDRYNTIAQKNLKLLQKWAKTDSSQNGKKYNTEFIDEPGKTKVITLIRLGDPVIIGTLEPGQIVELNAKSHYICVTTHNHDHIGALTDDVSYRLKQFIHLGYLYQAIIKNATGNSVNIFVKEITRPEHCPNPTFAY